MKKNRLNIFFKQEFEILFFTILTIFFIFSFLPLNCPNYFIDYKNIVNHCNNSYCGYIGNYIKNFLVKLLGISSYLIPMLMLITNLKLIINRNKIIKNFYKKYKYEQILANICLILSTACFFNILFSQFMNIDYNLVYSGGIIGIYITYFFLYFFHFFGTYLLLILFFLISIILLFNISFVKKINIFFSFFSFNKNKKKNISKKIKKIKFKKETKISNLELKQDTKFIKNINNNDEKNIFELPPLNLIQINTEKSFGKNIKNNFKKNAQILEKKFITFGVKIKIINVQSGPLITTYELKPAPGIKMNKILNLSNDISMSLKIPGMVRITPIMGKSVIGVEVPNIERDIVYLGDCFKDIDNNISKENILPIVLGKNTIGQSIISDLTKMPHLLLAGTTGSGKSIALNSMICSFLLKKTPNEVRMLMIDPKKIEFISYEGIPHLLSPIAFNIDDSIEILSWAVQEMERRYDLIKQFGVKNIETFNQYVNNISKKNKHNIQRIKIINHFNQKKNILSKLPYIIIFIDEMADLMTVTKKKDIEYFLIKLAQMARAAGIHLILATQRPSVNILTGTIKANFPTRIAFKVSSKIDSRIIIDTGGAEKLLGKGDMLFIPPGNSQIVRIHGAYISDNDIVKIVNFLKKNIN